MNLIKEVKGMKLVRDFESGKRMRGRLAATRSRRLMSILFAAADAKGVDVHDMPLVFYRTDDGRLSVIIMSGDDSTNRVYVSGEIWNVSCDEGFLTVKTKHGLKFFRTQFVVE